MSETMDWTEELKASCKTCTAEPASLVSQYLSAKRELPAKLEEMGIDQRYGAQSSAEKKLATRFYSAWLADRYPVVDMSFSKARATLVIERDIASASVVGFADGTEKTSATLKTFVISRYAVQEVRGCTGSLGDSKASLGHATFEAQVIEKIRRRGLSIDVVCSRPIGAPAQLRQRARDIRAIALEAQAAIVRAGGEIEDADLDTVIVWKPRLQDIHLDVAPPVREDPAVLVRIGDEMHHLIAFWDSPAEDSIDSLLREFASGDMQHLKT